MRSILPWANPMKLVSWTHLFLYAVRTAGHCSLPEKDLLPTEFSDTAARTVERGSTYLLARCLTTTRFPSVNGLNSASTFSGMTASYQRRLITRTAQQLLRTGQRSFFASWGLYGRHSANGKCVHWRDVLQWKSLESYPQKWKGALWDLQKQVLHSYGLW